MPDKTARFLANEVFPIALGGALGIMHVAQKNGTTLKNEATQILPKEAVELLFRPAQRKRQIGFLMDVITVAFAAAAQLKALDR